MLAQDRVERTREIGPAGRLAAYLYALVDVLVILAPAVAVRATGARSGIEGGYSLDLVISSGAIAGVHSVIASRRLLDEERAAHRTFDVWIASVNALVVLALASTLLITGVLAGFANQHAWLATRGAPVVALWAGVQLVAVALSEVTGRVVYRWLEVAATEEDAGDVIDAEGDDGERDDRERNDREAVGAGSTAGAGSPVGVRPRPRPLA